jgi:hypothetical protein
MFDPESEEKSEEVKSIVRRTKNSKSTVNELTTSTQRRKGSIV